MMPIVVLSGCCVRLEVYLGSSNFLWVRATGGTTYSSQIQIMFFEDEKMKYVFLAADN